MSNGRASCQCSEAVCKRGRERVVQEIRDLLQGEWMERGDDSKLPMLLEGEAFVVWLELSEEQQQSYTTAKKEILHSDQGRNFESSILAQTLQAFGVHKS